MKVTIEVDIAPQEIPAATELLRNLRLLADQIRVKSPQELFRSLIRRLAEPNQLPSVTADVITLLGPAALGPEAAGAGDGVQGDQGGLPLQQFQDAFLEVLFDPSLHPTLEGKKSVLPFLELLPRLPGHAQTELANLCKREVTRRMNEKRPVTTSRSSFYHFADAFACLVLLDYITVPGMLIVSTRLLGKGEDHQAAIITALARAVELCYEKILDQADPEKLAELSRMLDQVHSELRYDADYIRSTLGLEQLQTEPEHTHRVSPAVLQPRQSLTGSAKLNSVVWDEPCSRLVGAAGNGLLEEFDLEGQRHQSLDLSPYSVQMMDIMPSSHTIFACVMHKDNSLDRGIVRLARQGQGDSSAWTQQGHLTRFFVTCIKALGQDISSGFVTGENESGRDAGLVCLYDSAAPVDFSQLQPLTTYTDNQAVVSCLAALRSDPNVFLSGCVDNTIRVFDRRMPTAGAVLGTPMAAEATGPVHFVTSMDSANERCVVVGSYEERGTQGAVKLWDLRAQLSVPVTTVLTSSPVMHVAVGPDLSSVAFSTAPPHSQLYSVDLSQPGQSPGPVPVPAAPFGDGSAGGMCTDLKWAVNLNTLFAAGDTGRVDTYLLT